MNIRVEHVKHSKCRDDFLKRVKENEAKRKEGRGEWCQGFPEETTGAPRLARFVSSRNNKPVLVAPVPYEDLV